LLTADLAVVADYGVARALFATTDEMLTTTGIAVGTPSYMSPEQVEGKTDTGPSIDIYALGCVLYEMLTGKAPYEAESPHALLVKHVVEPVPSVRDVRRDVPEEVEEVVQRAMAKKLTDRFQSAAEMRTALESAAAGVVAFRATTTWRALRAKATSPRVR